MVNSDDTITVEVDTDTTLVVALSEVQLEVNYIASDCAADTNIVWSIDGV